MNSQGMVMKLTDIAEQPYLRRDVPEFASGDTVRVHVRVVEGNRERVQIFQGVVIARRGGGTGATFTVRKVSFGVGVERTFPVHSPVIAKIEVITKGDVRRAKLFYLRERVGKSAKIRERRDVDVAELNAAAEAAGAEAARSALEEEPAPADVDEPSEAPEEAPADSSETSEASEESVPADAAAQTE